MSQRKIIYTLIANNFPLHIPRVTYFAPIFHWKANFFHFCTKCRSRIFCLSLSQVQ